MPVGSCGAGRASCCTLAATANLFRYACTASGRHSLSCFQWLRSPQPLHGYIIRGGSAKLEAGTGWGRRAPDAPPDPAAAVVLGAAVASWI